MAGPEPSGMGDRGTGRRRGILRYEQQSGCRRVLWDRLYSDSSLFRHTCSPNTSASQYFPIVEFYPSGVTSDYQALQIEFQRHMSHGLQALAAYTWSHSIDYGSNDAANPLIRGNSDFDVR